MVKVVVAAWVGLVFGWVGFGAMAAIGAAQAQISSVNGTQVQTSLFSGQ